jgi:hypothetical protein
MQQGRRAHSSDADDGDAEDHSALPRLWLRWGVQELVKLVRLLSWLVKLV